ncbi:unnamed protein product [Nippostrongylus brasiliensis]|uniref:FMRFamide-like peptide 12 (inferred by orthology to a C. elegans protein) n=1 Tax=Nippostrongylus brasiliensis TaxID=27835 RepID=A0A0N4YE13_NIPBR|nr:unnamed protein product [Nippostrongylus brasiliensis]
MRSATVVLLLLSVIFVNAQKSHTRQVENVYWLHATNQHSTYLCSFEEVLQQINKLARIDLKGASELMQPLVYEADNSDLLAKVSSQLLSALANIESLQEGTPVKVAEKRRNKFEFIRFGRK